MKTHRHLISNKEGLHARTAVTLAQICRDTGCRVEVTGGDCSADGSDIFAVMKLNAARGMELEFRVDGSDEEEVMKQVIDFCRDFLTEE